MILSELFAAHLRAPSRREHGLVAALERAGFAIEAAAYRAWCANTREIIADGAWFGHRVAIGGEPPAAKPGALWFDICELALMACVRSRVDGDAPHRALADACFPAVSGRSSYEVQIPPPFTVLDPARQRCERHGSTRRLGRCVAACKFPAFRRESKWLAAADSPYGKNAQGSYAERHRGAAR